MIGASGFSNWDSVHPGLKNVQAVACVQGGVYCLDECVANTNTVTADDQVNNVIAVATANVAAGTMVVAQAATAAGAKGIFLSRGMTQCNVLGDSGQAYLTKLIPVNAQNYLASQSTNTNIAPVATCYQPNTNATTSLAYVKFDGAKVR